MARPRPGIEGQSVDRQTKLSHHDRATARRRADGQRVPSRARPARLDQDLQNASPGDGLRDTRGDADRPRIRTYPASSSRQTSLCTNRQTVQVRVLSFTSRAQAQVRQVTLTVKDPSDFIVFRRELDADASGGDGEDAHQRRAVVENIQ